MGTKGTYHGLMMRCSGRLWQSSATVALHHCQSSCTSPHKVPLQLEGRLSTFPQQHAAAYSEQTAYNAVPARHVVCKLYQGHTWLGPFCVQPLLARAVDAALHPWRHGRPLGGLPDDLPGSKGWLPNLSLPTSCACCLKPDGIPLVI